MKRGPGRFDLVGRHPEVADHLLNVWSHDLRVIPILAIVAGHARIVRSREHVGREFEAGTMKGLPHPLLGGEVENAPDVEEDRPDHPLWPCFKALEKAKAPPKRGLQR